METETPVYIPDIHGMKPFSFSIATYPKPFRPNILMLDFYSRKRYLLKSREKWQVLSTVSKHAYIESNK